MERPCGHRVYLSWAKKSEGFRSGSLAGTRSRRAPSRCPRAHTARPEPASPLLGHSPALAHEEELTLQQLGTASQTEPLLPSGAGGGCWRAARHQPRSPRSGRCFWSCFSLVADSGCSVPSVSGCGCGRKTPRGALAGGRSCGRWVSWRGPGRTRGSEGLDPASVAVPRGQKEGNAGFSIRPPGFGNVS